MRRHSIKALGAAVFPLIFMAITIFAVIEMNQTRTILARGMWAEATVVEAHHYRRAPDIVVVTFSTRTGEHVTTNVSDSIDASETHAGGSLGILYDPVHPEHVISAAVTDISHYYVLIPLPILAMIGAAWAGIRWASRR